MRCSRAQAGRLHTTCVLGMAWRESLKTDQNGPRQCSKRKRKCAKRNKNLRHNSRQLGSKNCVNRCGDVVFGRDQLIIVTNRKIGVQLFFGTPILCSSHTGLGQRQAALRPWCDTSGVRIRTPGERARHWRVNPRFRHARCCAGKPATRAPKMPGEHALSAPSEDWRVQNIRGVSPNADHDARKRNFPSFRAGAAVSGGGALLAMARSVVPVPGPEHARLGGIDVRSHR